LGRCLPKSKRSSRRSIGSNEHELENLGILDARTTSRSDLKRQATNRAHPAPDGCQARRPRGDAGSSDGHSALEATPEP
jgi:hypothetical protein